MATALGTTEAAEQVGVSAATIRRMATANGIGTVDANSGTRKFSKSDIASLKRVRRDSATRSEKAKPKGKGKPAAKRAKSRATRK